MTTEHPEGRVVWGAAVTDEAYRTGIPLQLKADSLGSRYRHLARVAALATGGKLNHLQAALTDAIDAGLTVDELREVLVHLYAYAGFPRSIQGLRALMEVVGVRPDAGSTDEGGGDAGAMNAEGGKYERGLRTLEELTGRSWAEPSDYGKFAPRIDTFLKEHSLPTCSLRPP